MSIFIKNALPLPSETIPASLRKTLLTSNLFGQGDRIALRVLNSLDANQYLVEVKQRQIQVTSRIPLEIGKSYIAEVSSNQGQIQLLLKPLVKGLIDSLFSQKQSLSGTFTSVLQKLNTALPPGQTLFSACQSAEAVRSAMLNCGMFYEARLLEAFRKGKKPNFPEDFKHFLLKQLSEGKSQKLQDSANSLLKNIDLRQLIDLQSGGQGPVFFWLPFFQNTFIEGFLRRSQEARESKFVVTLRLPFIESEELIVTILWQPNQLEICFTAGPLAEPHLTEAAPLLKERLQEIGPAKTIVRVSKNIPSHIKEELKGIRFIESYG